MDHTGGVVNGNNNNTNNIPYLDEGILTQIFMRTPIESLYSDLRYACKSWFDIITNSSFLHHNHHHLCQQQPRFLAQYEIPLRTKKSYHTYINSLTEQELEEFRKKRSCLPCLTYLFKLGEEGSIEEQVDLTPFFSDYWQIMSCCNGLMLLHCKLNASLSSTLYVVNILTKQRLILPPAPKTWNQETCVLVFLPTSGDYKVVLHAAMNDYKISGIEILTLPAAAGGCTSSPTTYENGLLRWRYIEAPVNIFDTLPPLAINGILYWVHHTNSQDYQKLRYEYLKLRYILSFDAAMERFYETPNQILDPTDTEPPPVITFQRAGFLELDGCLSLVSSRSHMFSEQNKLDIWVLKQDNGEWIKQSTLDIDNGLMRSVMRDDGYIAVLGCYEPILSFGNGQVIILCRYVGGRHPPLAYNVRTNQLWELKITGELDLEFEDFKSLRMRFYGSHVNSIVPFKSLFKNVD